MAFTSGSATDYHDLLNKLRLYLIAEGWTVNRWTAPAGLTTYAELAVNSPGSPGGQPANISIRTDFDTTQNAYAWKVSGHQAFDATKDYGMQPSNGPTHYFLLWPNGIDYRFYVNDRRVIVIAKIGTTYISMYAGFFLPFALPTEYPYPFFIGATYPLLAPYNIDNSGSRSFADPGMGSASYLLRDGMSWATFGNVASNANNVNDNYYGSFGRVTWPYRVPRSNDNSAGIELSWSWLQMQRPNAAGKTPMYQVMLLDHDDASVPGMLDGVFATSGFNRVPEQVLTYSAVDYRLFTNMSRQRPKDFFAVEEA